MGNKQCEKLLDKLTVIDRNIRVSHDHVRELLNIHSRKITGIEDKLNLSDKKIEDITDKLNQLAEDNNNLGEIINSWEKYFATYIQPIVMQEFNNLKPTQGSSTTWYTIEESPAEYFDYGEETKKNRPHTSEF